MKNMEGLPADIVISGVSGRFPESESLKEFVSNLLENRDLVTGNSRRFRSGLYGLPKAFGALKEIDKFDAEFFGILPKQADNMDPQLRIGLETTYEAMIDAGINPADERGSRTGVFTAIISHEAMELWARKPERMDGGNLIGSLGTMIPNRISYCFDFNGPSASYDTACSTSIFALDAAVSAIQTGRCDSAVVMGACLIINPSQSVMRDQAGMLDKDSVPRTFDPDGLGYVRAEAVATIYLQKACKAKKAYATIVGIGTNTDGYKERGIFYPSATMQEKLLEEVYLSAGVDPGEVTYLEAHGTGTPAGDPEEMKAISRHFFLNKNRKTPLLIGSVKSNMGHAEGASGLCSIAKVVALLQHGLIPANLHYKKPHYNMKEVRAGKAQVVSTNTEWSGGYIGLSSFGFGGVNSHVILKPHLPNEIENGDHQNGNHAEEAELPQLVTISGRTQHGVEKMLKELLETGEKNQLYLLNEINKSSTRGKYRGYGIIGSETTDVMETPLEKPPVWFIMSGMGSQWTGMGRSLFQFPAFKSAFDQCCEALSPYNYNLRKIYFSDDPNVYDSTENCFACIGTTQICLIDLLRCLGIKPDGMLGHSMGETLCAYADGCMTLRETILAVFLRGKPCEDLKATQEGSYGMAVVSMNATETAKYLPEELLVACHNAPDSTTISGPTDKIAQHASKLAKYGIVVKEVNSSGMAFHTHYVLPAAEAYYKVIKPMLKDRARSHRWISTSIPEDNWAKEGKLFGPEYLYNNFLSPVLFTEALKHIPEGAVIIEIGPSGLLRGLIQKATKDSTVVPLQSRNSDGSVALMNALGRLFVAGVNYDLNQLIGQKVQFPLPANTPLLGHLVDWDHSTSWVIPDYAAEAEGRPGIFDVCLARKQDTYLAGHTISGRPLYPAAGYIFLAWKHFAASLLLDWEDVPVALEDVKFLRATVLRPSELIQFYVSLLPAGGTFEIKEGNSPVCTGRVRFLLPNEERNQEDGWADTEKSVMEALSNSEDTQTTEDVYKRLRFLGYEYGGPFKGIQKVDYTGNNFLLNFNSNWVAFIDSLLQISVRIYGADEYPKSLSVPTEVSKMFINPTKFREHISTFAEGEQCSVFANYDPEAQIIKCKGFEVERLKMTKLTLSRKQEPPTLISRHMYDPYIYSETDEWKNDQFSPLLLSVCIVMENFGSIHGAGNWTKANIFEVCTKGHNAESLAISRLIRLHFAMPDIDYTMCVDDVSDGMAKSLARNKVKVQSIAETTKSMDWMNKQYDLIVIDEPLFLKRAIGGLRKGGFMILKAVRGRETLEEVEERLDAEDKYHLIAHKFNSDYDIFLIRKDTKQKCKEVEVIAVDNSTTWVDTLSDAVKRQEALIEGGKECPRLYLVSNDKDTLDSGVLGLTLCIRKEPFSQNVRCIYAIGQHSFDFQNPDTQLQEILDKDLVFNVIDHSGRLGCLLHADISSGDPTIYTSSAYVDVAALGDLSTLDWNQGIQFESLPPIPGLIPIDVMAAGLNFKDLMIATGNLAQEITTEYPHCYQSPIGFEFAGITNEGRQVCGISITQCIASKVLASDEFLWDIPNDWSYEQAATVPVAYSTAYLALVVRGQIKEGESVLIHLGVGSVGIAAIRIALSYKCQVFSTVSSEKKRALFRSLFPEIPEGNLGYSRDTRFEKLIQKATKGRGVDLVLNAITGDKMSASIRCLATHGRFLEIGKVDLVKNKTLGMDLFLRDIGFHGVQLDLVLKDGNPQVRQELKALIQEGIKSGVVQPLVFRAFRRDQVEPAFRYMGQGSHAGKVVVTIRQPEETEKVTVPAKRRIYFNPQKSYIVLGGLGGVGLEFVDWMTLRNARHITITSRTGFLTPYSRGYIKIWKERGVDVRVVTKNAIYANDAKDIFQAALEMAPIAGIFNLTLHLDIKLMKFQTIESFQSVMDPKITLTQHLDQLSRELCPELDHFVVFSSVSSALGFDGQGNYGFANSGAERLIERRVRDGLPGRAIQWGPISEVGAWHEFYNKDFQRTDFHGTAVQSIASALKSLDILFSIPGPPVTFCRKVLNTDASSDSGIVMEEVSLMERIAHILGHSSASKLNSKHKLVDLGMDSIMSMEVTHVLKTDFGMELSAGEIRGYTLEQLNEMCNNSRNESATVGAEMPKLKLATAGLVQLNFFKSVSKSRFMQTGILYPINQLAKDGYQQPGLPTVLICNSLEGPDVLRLLGTLTKAPCYSLQFSSLSAKTLTFPQIAEVFLEAIDNANVKGPFIIAGLSAGVFPAFEMAIRLQKIGQIVKLIWLDMTFERFKAVVCENFGSIENLDHVTEDELLIFLNSHIFGFDKTMLEKIIQEETTYEGKVERLLEILQEVCDGEIDEESMRNAAKSDWRPMISTLAQYAPSEMYHGETALVKTTQNLIAYDTNDLWGLDQICTKVPEIVVVDTTHSYLIAEPAVRTVAQLINDSLNTTEDF